jgi:hypothetical protein
MFYLCSVMPHPPATSDENAPDPRIVRCRRVVETLTEVGINLVRSLDPRRGDAPVRDPYLAYCRVSRALRLLLLLDQRLAALAAGGAAALAAEAALDAKADLDAIDAPETAEKAERPERETFPRPGDRETPDEVLRYLKRPLVELVAAICQGFGLSPGETAEAQAPFLAMAANDDPPPAAPAKPPPSARPRLRPPSVSGQAPARALGP